MRSFTPQKAILEEGLTFEECPICETAYIKLRINNGAQILLK